ncbi:MAG: hypothetical protein AAB225_21170 [Acidobacteriota bacterium]
MAVDQAKGQRRERWFGWWYLCIGLGFLLLGIRFLLLGDSLTNVILRWAIAAGFFALAWYQFRYGGRTR